VLKCYTPKLDVAGSTPSPLHQFFNNLDGSQLADFVWLVVNAVVLNPAALVKCGHWRYAIGRCLSLNVQIGELHAPSGRSSNRLRVSNENV